MATRFFAQLLLLCIVNSSVDILSDDCYSYCAGSCCSPNENCCTSSFSQYQYCSYSACSNDDDFYTDDTTGAANIGAIIGGIVGTVAGCGLLLFFCRCLSRRSTIANSPTISAPPPMNANFSPYGNQIAAAPTTSMLPYPQAPPMMLIYPNQHMQMPSAVVPGYTTIYPEGYVPAYTSVPYPTGY